MNKEYIKVRECSHIESYKLLNFLEKKNIKPIVKDISKSAIYAGFGNLTPNYVEIYVHKDQLKKSLKIIEKLIFI